MQSGPNEQYVNRLCGVTVDVNRPLFGPIQYFKAEGLINARPSTVWDILTDIGKARSVDRDASRTGTPRAGALKGAAPAFWRADPGLFRILCLSNALTSWTVRHTMARERGDEGTESLAGVPSRIVRPPALSAIGGQEQIEDPFVCCPDLPVFPRVLTEDCQCLTETRTP